MTSDIDELMYAVAVALISLLMVTAAQVGWSSGAIQETMLQGWWQGQRRLLEYVKRFIYLVLHVFVLI